MIRWVLALVSIMFACVLVWIFLFAPPEQMAARFAHEECRVVDLFDSATGQAIQGIEDMAPVPGSAAIVLSAHDRLDDSMPNGGLYQVSLFTLKAGGPLKLTNLVDLRGYEMPFRPHGIAISSSGDQLAVINRIDKTETRIESGPFSDGRWTPVGFVRRHALCRANNLAFSGPGGGELSITIDRGSCLPSISDYMPGARTGRVLNYAGEELTEQSSNLAFPNGIDGEWIAETRGNRVIATDGREIVLPGGPDNLTRDADGTLIAAVHPKLAQLGLYLNDWSGAAPSRVVRIDPASGAVEVLFDDPAGEVFSAATTGVLTDDHLIAGSVRDAGLLLCEPAG